MIQNHSKRRGLRKSRVASVLMAGLIATLHAQNKDDLGWRSIFDGKTMNGWYTYQNQAGKNADNGVFKIEKGAFHILDLPEGTTGVETNGCLLTNDDYSHVRVRLQYRWGTKQFAGRSGRGGTLAALPPPGAIRTAMAGAPAVSIGPGRGPRKKDAGLLYYYFGLDRIWGNNLELQIQEGDAGDMWVNGDISYLTHTPDPQAPAPLLWSPTGPTAVVKGNQTPGDRGGSGAGAPGAAVPAAAGAASAGPTANTMPAPGGRGNNEARRVLKSADWEDTGAWNTVEAVLDGQHVQHYVNGHLVLEGFSAMRRDPNDPEKYIPLTSGKLCLEAEGAEVWYRNIQVKPLGKSK